MLRFPVLLALAATTFSSAAGRTQASAAAQASAAPRAAGAPQTAAPQASVPSGGATLRTGTQLVVVDVTVLDRDGHPVHGLKASDFMMEESKKPQVIRNFDEHSGADPARAPGPKFPPLPPGTFTDYQQVPPDSTLNVLLLDSLNTPMSDQAYVRYQLQQYVKHAVPGTRIAIFGLNQGLTLLQGFSSDPEVLKAVVEHKLLQRSSPLLDDPSGSGVTATNMSDSASDAGASDAVVANLKQFEAQNATFQIQLRSTYTINAFKALGRYLAQFPGRKNLIWFSGSFPLTIFADPDLNDPFAVQTDASSDLREASNLLNRARVAVYPVDARGLQTNPAFSAAASGRGYARDPRKFGADSSKFNEANAQEHFTMEQVAEDTGGHAFYNTNDLASAVTKAITAGSNYYTLTYSPAERKTNGEYRSLKVQLQGEASARGVKLSYRHGYYAEDTRQRGPVPLITPTETSAGNIASPATAPAAILAFRDSSMQRGAPLLGEILFKVRVLPASTAVEDTVVSGNSVDERSPMKGPYRRYLVDFAALAGDFKVEVLPDGKRTGQIQFVTDVYDTDGRLLNTSGSTVQMNLELATYRELLKSGLRFHQEISVPARGESFLRIGIHDMRSDRIGVVEVATSSVSRLAPPPPPPVRAAQPTPAAVQPTPAAVQPAEATPARRTPPTLGPPK